MFGAPFACNFILAFGILCSNALGKEGILVHYGECLLKEVAVERVLVVAPQVVAIPGTECLYVAIAPV